MSNYPRPVVTADVIVWSREDDRIKVALVERGHEPFEGYFAIVGGHFDVETDESVAFAASRELNEETGIEADEDDLWFFEVYDAKGRDPRGRYVSHVYVLQVHPETKFRPAEGEIRQVAWVYEDQLDTIQLAFDHRQILLDFLSTIRDNP